MSPTGVAWALAAILLPSGARAQDQPELPRAYVDTTYAPPVHAKVIRVNAGGDLQAALDAVQPGDVLELHAGATFIGNFILPRKSGTAWIHVRSSDRKSTRLNSSHLVISYAVFCLKKK